MTDAGTPHYASDLADCTFLDLDGTGLISVIDHHAGIITDEDGSSHVDEENRIYNYVSGQLQIRGSADYFEGFERSTGQPAEQRSSFEISDPSKARQLIIVNGEPGGVNRVSSARITLNGQPIVGPSSFNQATAVIKLAVTLQAKNDVGVTLAGKPGGNITVLVLLKP